LSYPPFAATQAGSLFRHCRRRAWRGRLLRVDRQSTSDMSWDQHLQAGRGRATGSAWVHVPRPAVVTILRFSWKRNCYWLYMCIQQH